MGREVFGSKQLPSEIALGELLGWRFWRVSYEPLHLRSYSMPYIWVPGINESGDYWGETGERIPSAKNDVGFYAFKEMRDLLYYLQVSSIAPASITPRWYTTSDTLNAIARRRYTPRIDINCFGVVSLWGKVTEAELGYRAEFAEIKGLLSLYVIDEGLAKWITDCKLMRRLQEMYGIPDMREANNDC